MTYRSLFIEEHPDRASATILYDSKLKRGAPLFCFLNAQTWPTSALAFAEEHELHVDYVDNCWLLVALDAAKLRLFLSGGQASDPNVAAILERVKDDHWYVVNEEEF